MLNAQFWQGQRKYDTDEAQKEYNDFKVENYKNLEIQTWTDKTGKLILRVYRGKSGKAIAHYYYRSVQDRDNAINRYKASADAQIKHKKERAEARKNVKNPFKVGDILCSTWGYEQTNVDFYEVVDLTEKSVKLIQIGQRMTEADSQLSEYVVPDQSHRGKTVMTKRVRAYRDSGYVSISSFSVASKWGGQPILQTHWH